MFDGILLSDRPTRGDIVCLQGRSLNARGFMRGAIAIDQDVGFPKASTQPTSNTV
ncbi:hypothetical protein [Calothrix sp. PCC 7507]|uniref:hypothetical protein n=1 Tax=Calothrix sp. PCC 7507 TaxID=99598 RepID=UPI0002EA6AD7|nr:hypothetical protein [Calothrix sp. PCC 7507]